VRFENPHEILDGDASLLRHHKAKEQLRHHQLDLIPIPNGGLVLDIGIGPGLYLKHWLESTKSKNVHFDLFDSSESALKTCADTANKLGDSKRVQTIKGDLFKELSGLNKNTYDVIFIGNTIEYIPNPTDFITNHLIPLLKPGGILAIRDLDCSFMSCNTVDQPLNARIVRSRIENNAANSIKDTSNYQNPFIGKELEAIVSNTGLEVIAVHPFMIQFNGPIVGPQKVYLEALHRTWYVEDTLGILSAQDKAEWANAFDSSQPGNIFDNPATKYIEAEFLVIGRKK